MRYWLGVVSKEHVLMGIQGSFAQLCHGKKGPLLKLSKGDGFIYYSPKLSIDKPQICRAFTAVGRVITGVPYQVEMTQDFHPYRIDIRYLPAKEIAIEQLFNALEFTQRKNWGVRLRAGFLELSEEDFFTIADAMGSNF